MATTDFVAKLKAQGFSEWESCGGCTALRKDLTDLTYVLVTDTDASVPVDNGPFVIGYYVEDEQKLSEIIEDAATALRKVELFCKMPPVD